MNHITKTLCQKYTDLNDREIAHIESYLDMLPALANAEEADVFIDCRTVTARSAIVVCEAKPQTVPSNYVGSILGMLIRWENEPAVERSFRLGVATVGVRAVSMPEDRKIVQTVEPIFFEGRLIGVLIYEKPAISVEELVEASDHQLGELGNDTDWDILSQYLEEAVLLLDDHDYICGYNKAASHLNREMGYVGSLMGMEAENVQPAAMQAESAEWCEVETVNRVLQYRKILLMRGRVYAALMIRDVTLLRQTERMYNLQQIAYREMRHRMKNHLYMIANLIGNRSCEVDSIENGQNVLRDTANRLRSIATTLEETAQRSPSRVSLRYMIERIREYMLQTLLISVRGVNIEIEGEDLEISDDQSTSVALVVNELVQNAIQHAFPNGKMGNVGIRISRDTLFCTIEVWDDGVGFSKDYTPGTGLRLAESIVREKLIGEWKITSSDNGVWITFDFPIL